MDRIVKEHNKWAEKSFSGLAISQIAKFRFQWRFSSYRVPAEFSQTQKNIDFYREFLVWMQFKIMHSTKMVDKYSCKKFQKWFEINHEKDLKTINNISKKHNRKHIDIGFDQASGDLKHNLELCSQPLIWYKRGQFTFDSYCFDNHRKCNIALGKRLLNKSIS